jgi:RNA polymerase sigma-70 factor (ECF subfamily)
MELINSVQIPDRPLQHSSAIAVSFARSDPQPEKTAIPLDLLYDSYGGVVYGVALKILKHPQEAEDLTQEIFLELWRNPIFNPKHRYFLRYSIAMTRSRAIDKLRSRRRTLSFLQRWGQTVISIDSSLSTPFQQVALTERAERVREALAQLSEKQRQVIEMSYDKGLSQVKIARQLNTPLGTVKSRTRQGLLKLKQILQDSVVIGN